MTFHIQCIYSIKHQIDQWVLVMRSIVFIDPQVIRESTRNKYWSHEHETTSQHDGKHAAEGSSLAGGKELPSHYFFWGNAAVTSSYKTYPTPERKTSPVRWTWCSTGTTHRYNHTQTSCTERKLNINQWERSWLQISTRGVYDSDINRRMNQ